MQCKYIYITIKNVALVRGWYFFITLATRLIMWQNIFIVLWFLGTPSNIDKFTSKYVPANFGAFIRHVPKTSNSLHYIERQIKRLRKGDQYTFLKPLSLVFGLQRTKNQFHDNVMQYQDFKNVKSLATQMGGINVKDLRVSEIKVMKFEKLYPNSVSLKYSYFD